MPLCEVRQKYRLKWRQCWSDGVNMCEGMCFFADAADAVHAAERMHLRSPKRDIWVEQLEPTFCQLALFVSMIGGMLNGHTQALPHS